MEWSKILHPLAAILGIGGAIIMVIYWISLLRVKWQGDIGIEGGSFLGFTSKHLFKDALLLFLGSLVFGIGTLIHQNIEK